MKTVWEIIVVAIIVTMSVTAQTRIMCVGDSITEGTETVYLAPGALVKGRIEAYNWYDDKDDCYYAVLKDMCGAFSDAGRSVVLFQSPNGLDWLPHEDVLVTDRSIRMADGSTRQYTHLERPQLYIENGTPRALCFAADMNRDHSCNIQVPLGDGERL